MSNWLKRGDLDSLQIKQGWEEGWGLGENKWGAVFKGVDKGLILQCTLYLSEAVSNIWCQIEKCILTLITFLRSLT